MNAGSSTSHSNLFYDTKTGYVARFVFFTFKVHKIRWNPSKRSSYGNSIHRLTLHPWRGTCGCRYPLQAVRQLIVGST